MNLDSKLVVSLLGVLLALTACSGTERTNLRADQFVDRPLVEATLGVKTAGGGGFAAAESVFHFNHSDGERIAFAMYYTDWGLESTFAEDVLLEFEVDCVSVAIYATRPFPRSDVEALGMAIEERMQAHAFDC